MSDTAVMNNNVSEQTNELTVSSRNLTNRKPS